ncbi:zinc-ribbon transposase [Vibrio phage 1.152.O._10N.222.46.E1]|uniref:Zinc-ribbon transposase n=5 Tax=Nahantvirus 49C7 TaxID=2846601 RepID=A0A2I7RB90_9CAUD|nr:zinc-ribbon transposase [Vibrio phage 1.026.O._10N.222.49.C7]AUR82490.1 zinc-ribbon transposase [Vibrio phage 1.025.O._10N.222.46.B6]AUR90740.1 zinc-ribbon transposase [Vibrio phage 1.150.O._10N.222.46.A6]AUR90912.1 zinc-ribbon transposase [Vibrio phage 1.152.O._10N.222.46.E1]AUS02381.1 zinc-ribbon transposase [Vibrio phage 2.130.O._10N.222.46.C2]AUR82598.1 zinc-ribbon transposase [Vibrio phage 1.026.O._10N.222.49.C7]
MGEPRVVCPKCGSTDIGLVWGYLNFNYRCRECHHGF